MPKSKEWISSDSESDGSSDGDYESEAKKKKTEGEAKKKKTEGKKEKSEASSPKEASSKRKPGDEVSFQLSRMRFVSVKEFRGKKLVNIREFYEKNGQLLPGKKGIALSEEQWSNLKKFKDEIDQALADL